MTPRPAALLALPALLGALLLDGSPAAAATDVVPGTSPTGALVAVGLAAPGPQPTAAPTPEQPAVDLPQGVVTERVPVRHRVVRRADPHRRRGTTAVVARGRDGVLERTWVDLGAAGRVLVRSDRVREPRTEVVAVGTAVPPTYGGLHWDALAQCESGGDPRAVSSGGTYRGLYQFDLRTWRSVGGSGDPVDAGRDEQTSRAYALYQGSGRSPWPACGKRL